jgi:triosephosphate isomerase (TIM)
MNGDLSSIKVIVQNLNDSKLADNVEVVIAPPFPYLLWTKEHLKAKTVEISAQNSFNKGNGAFTGETSVAQIKDVGAAWVILGHSERRTIIKESDEFIASKAKYAIENGLSVIYCIGETLDERKAEKTIAVVQKQIDAAAAALSPTDWDKVVIAYEPVWAIGTGLAATPADAQEVHEAIRKHIANKVTQSVADKVRILYGGSVKGDNAATFIGKDIDGFLVGGACLKPEFVDIINSRS